MIFKVLFIFGFIALYDNILIIGNTRTIISKHVRCQDNHKYVLSLASLELALTCTSEVWKFV